ncbi:hypothetical protein SCAR479_08730 [Seiridium cardinale]|uniref:Uncharacterized protein n=1 Tax=Seiridium cardinale TaxID=138064 RepID=A0ABR2XLF6_9PEZI
MGGAPLGSFIKFRQIELVLKEADIAPWRHETMHQFEEEVLQLFAPQFKNVKFIKGLLKSLDQHVAMLHELPDLHEQRLRDLTITVVALMLHHCNKELLSRRRGLLRCAREQSVREAGAWEVRTQETQAQETLRAQGVRGKRPRYGTIAPFIFHTAKRVLHFYEHYLSLKSK